MKMYTFFQNAKAITSSVPPSVMRQNHVAAYRKLVLDRLLSRAQCNANTEEVVCDLPFCIKPDNTGPKRKELIWVECDKCARWCHLVCAHLQDRPEAFVCIVCQLCYTDMPSHIDLWVIAVGCLRLVVEALAASDSWSFVWKELQTLLTLDHQFKLAVDYRRVPTWQLIGRSHGWVSDEYGDLWGRHTITSWSAFCDVWWNVDNRPWPLV